MKLKIHKSYRLVVAVCDSELVGKKFEEGNKTLDVRENFYSGEGSQNIEEKELIEMMEDLSREDATFSIIGEKSVSCALKAGIIRREGIKKVSGISFALVLM